MVFDIFKKAGVFFKGKIVSSPPMGIRNDEQEHDENHHINEHTINKAGKLVHIDEVHKVDYFEIEDENELGADCGAGH